MKRSFLIHRSPGHLAAAIGALLSQGCSDDDSPTAVYFDWDSGVSWDAGDLTTDETSSTATAEVPAERDASVDDTSTSAPTTSVSTASDESTLDTTTSDPTSSTSTEIDASIDASTTTTSDGADASDSLTSTSSQTTTTSETTSFILDAGSPDAALDASESDASESDASESDASEEDGGGFDGSADSDACNSCSNGVMDGDETGLDCGGCCNSCTGTACTSGEECASGLCSGSICILPAGVSPTLPSGTLTSFERFQTGESYVDLPVTLQNSAAVTFGDKVYVLGGQVDNVASNAIYEASMDQNGLLQSFALNTSYQLTTARVAHRADIIGGYVYVFGGTGTSGLLDTVERAPLGSNGIVGDFEVVAGVTLETARRYFALVTTPAFVYVIGGNYPQLDTVERATVDQLGSITSSFTTLTRVEVDANTAQDGMNQARWTHATARLGDDIYLIGGESMSSSEKTTIQNDGSLGNFVLHNPLPSNRNRVNVAILADRIYAFGGWNLGFLSTIEEAPITGGEVGIWATGSITLEVPVENGTAVQTDAAVYLFGGSNGTPQSVIQRAFIQSL